MRKHIEHSEVNCGNAIYMLVLTQWALVGKRACVCGAGGGLGVGWTPRVHGVARCLASARGTLRVRGGHRGCGLTVAGEFFS